MKKDEHERASENAIAFRDICVDMHKQNKHLSYDFVVNAVLKSNLCTLMQDATLADIGYVFGITRERVRQIENQAMNKMINPGNVKGKKLFFYAKDLHILNTTIGGRRKRLGFDD